MTQENIYIYREWYLYCWCSQVPAVPAAVSVLASASHGSSHPSVSLHCGAAVRTPGHLQYKERMGLGRVLGVVWILDSEDRCGD